MKLALLEGEFAVCRLSDAGIPAWAEASLMLCYTKTLDEYSLLCESALVPESVKAERDWRCIRVVGTLDFAMVGVIAKLSAILAAAHISIFVVSTYDTDYLLVRSAKLEDAVGALEAAGYRFD